jgi:hypothetical protein
MQRIFHKQKKELKSNEEFMYKSLLLGNYQDLVVLKKNLNVDDVVAEVEPLE